MPLLGARSTQIFYIVVHYITKVVTCFDMTSARENSSCHIFTLTTASWFLKSAVALFGYPLQCIQSRDYPRVVYFQPVRLVCDVVFRTSCRESVVRSTIVFML